MTAAKYPRARRNVPWLISHPAVRANEAIAPSSTLKICSARRFIREETLKLRQRARKRQIASLKNVDSHGGSSVMQMLTILPVVVGCYNRISTA
jgi:hypothetical protein